MNKLFSLEEEFYNDTAFELTPVVQIGGFWIKRDDLFQIEGVNCYGGKVRTCYYLSGKGSRGLVTAGSRSSPQINIVAQIGRLLGLPVRAHCPMGELSLELLSAKAAGAEIIQHPAGYNSVIIARARADAQILNYTEIPFGMDTWAAVYETKKQVENIPNGVQRIIIPVGSGMSLAGVLWGLFERNLVIPVIGVVVGANPIKRLNKYAPPGWRKMVHLIESGVDYHKPAKETKFAGIALDSIYEAKCIPFIQPGDLLWIVGVRETERSPEAEQH